jgi:uncharacterized phage infection (PIP) family protein YhgE
VFIHSCSSFVKVNNVTAASQEQFQCIEQINKNVTEMDEVTQQTAAHAEESASSSEEMHAQAEKLKHFVRDLPALVHGSENGVAAENRLEPLSEKIARMVNKRESSIGPGKNLIRRGRL